MPGVLLPTVEPPAVVVVTGANGFVAQHCIDQLLHQGYQVVGTVRSVAKAKGVLNTHSHHPALRVVVVADITLPEQYVEVLKPLSPAAICHVATPFTPHVTNVERDIMVPAVLGATAILEAAVRIGNIKKVAYMSSFAAVFDPSKGSNQGKTYTSRDWNPQTYEDGVNASDWFLGYTAAKGCAEKAAWDFMRRHRDVATFDLISLCPVMVHGPWLPRARPHSVRNINTSNAVIWAVVSAGRRGAITTNDAPLWVDVRDVADACVRALTVPEAAGRRFTLCASTYCNQQIADVAREISPKADSIPLGVPGRRDSRGLFDVDTSDAEEVLGIRWRSLRESLADLVPQLFAIPDKTAPVGDMGISVF